MRDADSPRSVLIIEDDDSLRIIVSRQLRAVGFEVMEAGSAEAAQSVLADGFRPRAIVLDINLPGDTGWDLLRSPAVRGAGSPPIVITSAGSISPRKLAEFGCAGWLPKPFPIETLVDTLDRVMAARAPGSLA
jgi:DNA-binding NtrC family response regulator